jgi:hypothetical protein
VNWSAEEASSWPGKLQGELAEAVVSSEGDGEARDWELHGRAPMAAGGSLCARA